jgi:cobalt-precorrin 5A hydrolase/precorrin-3B C17-methyltransferase
MTEVLNVNVDGSPKDIAIVAITRKGLALGRRLKTQLPGQLYLPEKLAKGQKPDEYSFSSTAREVVRDVFHRYRHLVLIMAVGIAVRLIASEIRDKHTDPGVVVIDDYGSFSVSLLSGHEGGANQLARRVASLLGAYPVVTTASDVRETMVSPPRSLVIGIGCHRGTAATEIEKAVTNLFFKHELSVKSVRKIATIDIKRNEPGLLEFARKHKLPIEYFDKETLRKAKFPSSPSATALKHAGTPSVCESAALLSSRNNSLIIPKASFNRKVTIAVAQLARDSEKEKQGTLFLVGIGPGSSEHMTFRAQEAISHSEAVVGYEAYIKLIEPWLGQKKVIATGMGAEVERAKTAIGLAREGRTVSLVSSGDSGIYGMAGLVGEILHEQAGSDIDIEVIPGVPLLAACAARLGSPISGDFAAISLSDYLISWREISHRIALAAQGNFVIIIYNPRSKKRQSQLAEARDIVLRYYSPSTTVGIVTNAYRQKQKVFITDLEHMLDYEIGMNTTIIIGNSTTFIHDGRMVTPRGYGTKYSLSQERE